MKYFKLKSMMDFIFALVLLIITVPFLIIISIFIMIEDRDGPIIFKQKRLGKNEREFNLYKFRSMRTKVYSNHRKLTDKERMLKVGRIVRKTSLDELPQLVNILKGEMSFIGPRPLFIEYLPYYTDREKYRHSVRPGISGWAQVNGRNNLSWEEKFSYDIYYVNNISFTLDTRILLLTIKKVLLGSDVIEDTGQANTQTLIDYRLKQKSKSVNCSLPNSQSNQNVY